MNYKTILRKTASLVPFLGIPIDYDKLDFTDVGAVTKLQGNQLSVIGNFNSFIGRTVYLKDADGTILNGTVVSTIYDKENNDTIIKLSSDTFPTADNLKFLIPLANTMGWNYEELENLTKQNIVRLNTGFHVDLTPIEVVGEPTIYPAEDEDCFSDIMQTIIAHINAYFLLQRAFTELFVSPNKLKATLAAQAAATFQQNNGHNGTTRLELKRAKAASAETEFMAVTDDTSKQIEFDLYSKGLVAGEVKLEAVTEILRNYMLNIHRAANQMSVNHFNYIIDIEWSDPINRQLIPKRYEQHNRTNLVTMFSI